MAKRKAKVSKKETSSKKKMVLQGPTSSFVTDPVVKRKDVIGLVHTDNFFLQGEKGINLTPSDPWAVIPDSIEEKELTQIASGIDKGHLKINHRPKSNPTNLRHLVNNTLSDIDFYTNLRVASNHENNNATSKELKGFKDFILKLKEEEASSQNRWARIQYMDMIYKSVIRR